MNGVKNETFLKQNFSKSQFFSLTFFHPLLPQCVQCFFVFFQVKEDFMLVSVSVRKFNLAHCTLYASCVSRSCQTTEKSTPKVRYWWHQLKFIHSFYGIYIALMGPRVTVVENWHWSHFLNHYSITCVKSHCFAKNILEVVPIKLISSSNQKFIF